MGDDPGEDAAREGAAYCTKCPVGFQCDGRLKCPQGYYVRGGSCEACPAGYVCRAANEEPVRCEPGTYSAEGQMDCAPCPGNTYSESGSGACSPCPSGKVCENGLVKSTSFGLVAGIIVAVVVVVCGAGVGAFFLIRSRKRVTAAPVTELD